MRERLAALLAFSVVVSTTAGCDEDGSPNTSADYSATLAITNDVGVLGSLAVDLRFRGSNGEIVSDDGAPRCELVIPDAFVVLTRRSSDRVSIGISSFTGITTPTSLVRCRVRAAKRPKRRELAADLREAVATDGFPPVEQPLIAVTGIRGAPAATTTTSPAAATTSTLSD
jgi:hypothetical protein